jgi:dTDP-4-dehydrorhamnose reductase
MLGHKVVQRLVANRADVWWTLRGSGEDAELAPVPELRGDHAVTGIDALRFDDLEAVLRDLRPAVVVNCLGVIKQLADVTTEAAMMAINAELPHRLVESIGQWNGRLIHISTDCVFSGRTGNYSEEDVPDPVDLYGRSKLLGEVRAANAVTLRTSMIGRELRHHVSLVDWFLAQNNRTVRGYRRAIWSGATTNHLASIIESVIDRHRGLAGLHHVAGGRISKFELLHLLRSRYDLNIEIEPDDGTLCDRSLVGAQFERVTGHRCPPLPALIDEMIADPTPYPELS